MTGSRHEELIAREKPAYDGVVPSGNSVMIMNLLRLHALTEDSELRRQMGRAARNRAAFDFSYDRLVSRLAPIAAADFSMLEMLSR